MASGSGCPVASRAPLLDIERRAFFGCPPPGRELLSRRADCDVPGADFFPARGPPEAVGGRLCPAGLASPDDRRNEEKLRQAHWKRSHRLRPSTVECYCRRPEPASCPRVRCSIWRPRLWLV